MDATASDFSILIDDLGTTFFGETCEQSADFMCLIIEREWMSSFVANINSIHNNHMVSFTDAFISNCQRFIMCFYVGAKCSNLYVNCFIIGHIRWLLNAEGINTSSYYLKNMSWYVTLYVHKCLWKDFFLLEKGNHANFKLLLSTL